MAELFELSAALKMETDAFEQSIRNAVEMAARMQERLESNTRTAAVLTAQIAAGMAAVSQNAAAMTGAINSGMDSSSQQIRALIGAATGGLTGTVSAVEILAGQVGTQLDHTAERAAASMTVVEAAANGAWSRITASIQQAIDQTNAFLSMKGTQQITVQTNMIRQEQVQPSLTTGKSLTNSFSRSAGASIGNEVASALSGVSVLMDGKVVGELVANEVDRELGQLARTRRYTG